MSSVEIAKTALIGIIAQELKRRELSGPEVSALLFVTRYEYENLVAERADLFDLEKLIRFSDMLNKPVTIEVKEE